MSRLRAQWRTVRILHVALLFSLVMYGVVLVVMSQQPDWAKPPASPPMPASLLMGVLGGVALVNLFIVIPTIHRLRMPPRDRVGDDRLDLDDPKANEVLLPLMKKLQPVLILTWAMCESVAIFGLVVAFVFHEPVYAAPFAAVSVLAFLWHAPTLKFLASIYRGALRV